MKKYIFSLFALALPILMLAQSPEGRTAKTIVADALAKMPAQNSVIYTTQMNDLVSELPETFDILVSMMKTPHSAGNMSIEYAINGLCCYVTTCQSAGAQAKVAASLVKALEGSSDRETKAFYIRQLQICGADDVVETLIKYAKDKEYSNEAIAALSSIATPKTKASVEAIITSIPDKKVAAKAIRNFKITSAEQTLLSWLNSGDADLQKAVVNALAVVGGEASIKTLAKEVSENSFSYEQSGTLAAYLAVVKNLPLADSEKTLTKLLKNKDLNVRSSAITILADKKATDVVVSAAIKALDVPCRAYRNTAIKAAVEVAGCGFLKNKDIKLASRADEVKCDILYAMGQSRNDDFIGDITAYIAANDVELQQTAFEALAYIASDKALAPIFDIFATNNAQQTKNAVTVLKWTHSDINSELVSAIKGASDSGKQAIIELLAARAASKYASEVIALTKDGKFEVSKAAYAALKSVSTKRELPQLYKMLESDTNNTLEIQQAISSALAGMDSASAFTEISNQIDKAPASKKHLYYATLAATNSPKAFETVKAGVESSDANVKKAAITSALGWKGAEAIPTVFDILANPEHKNLQAEAVKSYILLVNLSKSNNQQEYLLIRKALEAVKDPASQNELLKELTTLNSFGALVTAAKYMSNPATEQMAGTAVLNIAQKDKEYANWSQTVKDILTQFIAIRKGGDAGYEKTAIQKYINEAPAEVGYVKIFNEKNLDGWKGLVANPIARSKMSASELAEKQAAVDADLGKGWVVKDGVLYFTGHGNNLCTDKKYGDIEMYVDWYIEPEGDAGIYLRGSPQVQIWDTSRVSVGAQVGSGGLYNNAKHESKPPVVADNAVGEWNTFYIKMVGERVTVDLNGIRVVDNVIMENYWDRKIPIFTEEQLELQAHGTVIGYRDIYVKELPKVDPITLTAEEEKDGFKLLFDGVSMNEWIGNTKDYVAENGTITLYPGNGGGGNLYSKEEYEDFVFRFDFLLTDAANNGLGIRTPMEGDAAYVGMELQILDNEHEVYKNLEEYQYHGSVYGVIPAKRGFLKPIGEWNTQEVYVKGNKIKITLNGEVILDGDLAEASKNGTLDHNDHPGLKNKSGHIAFLGHGSLVKFRNIRVKSL